MLLQLSNVTVLLLFLVSGNKTRRVTCSYKALFSHPGFVFQRTSRLKAVINVISSVLSLWWLAFQPTEGHLDQTVALLTLWQQTEPIWHNPAPWDDPHNLVFWLLWTRDDSASPFNGKMDEPFSNGKLPVNHRFEAGWSKTWPIEDSHCSTTTFFEVWQRFGKQKISSVDAASPHHSNQKWFWRFCSLI